MKSKVIGVAAAAMFIASCDAMAADASATDAFASLGHAPMATKAPLRVPDFEAPPANSLMIFGGQFTDVTILKSLDPFSAHHENQYIVAAAYGRDFFHVPYGFVVGGEVGLGFRFGMGQSEELWAGFSVRHTGFNLLGLVRVGGAFIFGFSGISNATGREAVRQGKDPNGSARFLGYLAPELTFSLPQYPNWELIYRLHHRSGLYGVLADNIEGANANVVGIRYRF